MVGTRRIRRVGLGLAPIAMALAVLLIGAAPASAQVSRRADPSWSTNGPVMAVLRVGNRIYLGGDFTQLRSPTGQVVARNRLAALDASTGNVISGWAPQPDGEVLSLAASAAGTRIYAGGEFSKVNGANHRRIVALQASDGAVLPGWKVNANRGSVMALTVSAGRVYAGGTFSAMSDRNGKHASHYLVALDVVTGDVVTGWNPTPDSRVRALAVSADGSTIYVGGDFKVVSAQKRRFLAELSATSGSVLPVRPSAPGQVYSLWVDGTALYVGASGRGGNCARLDAATGAQAWDVHTNGNVQAVALYGGLVYCGGHFSGSGSFGGVTRYKLASVDPANGAITTFAPRINSALGVRGLAVDSAHLYVGGEFTKISGVAQQGFAQFTDR